MDEPTEEQLNKWGHKLLGLCWHEPTESMGFEFTNSVECLHCQADMNVLGDVLQNPNYCQDLNEARLVEEVGIERVGTVKLGVELLYAVLESSDATALPFASAKQRMTAAYRAMEGK